MYKDEILSLISQSPLEIDTEIEVGGAPPTLASTEFLTNKEQGDWAEEIVFKAINEFSDKYFAVKYGRSDSLTAGDDGFSDFYKAYQEELNNIGKKPDILIFKKDDFPRSTVDIENDDDIVKAVAALEVRSSAFLAEIYKDFMEKRQEVAIKNCNEIRQAILENAELNATLKKKNKTIYDLLVNANEDTFKELSFRRPSWSLTPQLRRLTELLKELKENILVLHKRDYLSITPKVEDIALVNRWIQKYNIKHFYLQVFLIKHM